MPGPSWRKVTARNTEVRKSVMVRRFTSIFWACVYSVGILHNQVLELGWAAHFDSVYLYSVVDGST